MGLFSSVKIAPGIRLSTSSRGLRAHVGPRVARIHVGDGRSGVSTGAGPFTLYGNTSGSARPRNRSTGATSGMTPAQAEKARQVEEVRRAWDELATLHRATFPAAAEPGVVTPEPVPMFSVLLREAEREQLAGIPRRDRDARRDALSRARDQAEGKALSLLADGMRDTDQRQRVADQSWEALVAGEPDAVRTAVAHALSTRGLSVKVESPKLGVVSMQLSLPGEELLPTHGPSMTPKGLPTLKKLNKTEVAEQVRQLAAARVLLAVKEAFAQSPGVHRVQVTGLRSDGKPILGADIARADLQSASWHLDAWNALTDCDPELQANIGGRTMELRPLSTR